MKIKLVCFPYMDNFTNGMDSDFKGSAKGIFSTPRKGVLPLRHRPHANHVPLRVEGVYDYHGGGLVKPARWAWLHNPSHTTLMPIGARAYV